MGHRNKGGGILGNLGHLSVGGAPRWEAGWRQGSRECESQPQPYAGGSRTTKEWAL